MIDQFIDIQTEQAVLGALILEGKIAYRKAAKLLDSECFLEHKHRFLFGVMQKYLAEGLPFDMLILVRRLRTIDGLKAIGGSAYLTELTSRVASSANIAHHAQILVQASRAYKLALHHTEELRKITQAPKMIDPFELAEKGISKLAEILALPQGEIKPANSDEYAYMEELEKDEPSVLSGIASLDDIVKFKRHRFYILGARPSMGKTAAVTTITVNMLAENTGAEKKNMVCIFSLEMTRKMVLDRMHCKQCMIDASKFEDHTLLTVQDKQHISAAHKGLGDALYIEDNIYDFRQISAVISEMRVKQQRLGYQNLIIMLDYLQLTKYHDKHNNEEDRLTRISQGLKRLAKEADCIVIALAQLNRAVEARGGDKVPNMSDLRGSGSLEQDADSVIFLHRAEYYGFEVDENGESTKNRATFIVAKNRSGKTGKANTNWYGQHQSFQDNELWR